MQYRSAPPASHQAMGQGIFVHKTEDAIVRGNRILPAEPVEFLPGLTIREPVKNIRAENNSVSRLEIAPALVNSGAVLSSGNIVRSD